jgi:hypothetical protein
VPDRARGPAPSDASLRGSIGRAKQTEDDVEPEHREIADGSILRVPALT